MAAIDDLIAQVEDPALRGRLREEFGRLIKKTTFGLVFQEHLPELTSLYSAKVRKGCLVVLRGGSFTDTWRVLSLVKEQARCVNRASGERRELAVSDLVVVRQFGEPIFPSLVPVDRLENGGKDRPWHTLIEADNYHALQLLEYCYAGQVDCIYIDPPYNTGARDWKYNNDYVDANDRWRHSKWLAMMNRRLLLAKGLLKPDTGVLIVTIDTNELHHLGMLLAEIFPDARHQVVTICINPSGTSGEGLSRVEEYAAFCFLGGAQPSPMSDDLLLPVTGRRAKHIRWESLMRGGTAWYRKERDKLCYPIVLDETGTHIVDVGDPLPFHDNEALDIAEEQRRPLRYGKHPLAWPLRSDGQLGIWRVDNKKLKELASQGYAYVSSKDEQRGTWTIRYLMEGTVDAISRGEIAIEDRGSRGEALLRRLENKRTIAKTIWNRGRHTAGGAGGSTLLVEVLGRRNAFSFPKSIYSTKDALEVAVGNRPGALIVDFFAGSGTTLNAVDLLNTSDGGRRRCILVTNNEVSAAEAETLLASGVSPGTHEWEQQGICRSVAWPRCKYTIMGKRDDGAELEGDYLTGRPGAKEKMRRFQQIGFVDASELDTATKKKQLVALIKDFPQSEVKWDSAFLVSDQRSASVLFDETQADAWLSALEGQDHISDFYIVTRDSAVFDDLRRKIADLLSPLTVPEDEKRPMRVGFPANLEYFKLNFLDKDQVALGRRLREILPILWLRAGAIGPRPQLPADAREPDMVISEQNRFAVLVDETRFAAFADALSARADITHVFLVTDSEDAFQEMASQVSAPHVFQLYRDYLENFMINKGDGA